MPCPSYRPPAAVRLQLATVAILALFLAGNPIHAQPAEEPFGGLERSGSPAPATGGEGAVEQPGRVFGRDEGRAGDVQAPVVTYTVKRGDWLSKIVTKFYRGHVESYAAITRQIIERNGLDANASLRVGQVLELPYPYAGQPRTYRARRTGRLDAIAGDYYGWTSRPELWWPYIRQSNPSLEPSPRAPVRAGATLVLPPIPVDAAERSRLARRLFDESLTSLTARLDAGDLEAARAEKHLLIEGLLPLLTVEAPDDLPAVRERLEQLEERWSRASLAVDLASLERSASAEVDVEGFLGLASDLSERLDVLEKSIGSALAGERRRLEAAVELSFRRAIERVSPGIAADGSLDDVRSREARRKGFEIQYWLSRLQARARGLAAVASRLEKELAERLSNLPPPEAQYPAWTMQASRRPGSTTVRNPRYRADWMPMAAAYARGLWKDFPQVNDIFGDPITHEQVIHAIVMHESRGIHHDGRGLMENRNSPTNSDIGLAQINVSMHARMSVRLREMVEVIDDPAWTVGRLAGPRCLDVPRSQWNGPVRLDFHKPAHNLVAAVVVLSYSMNRAYPRTATVEDRLVKSLSAYNHGAFSRDYDMAWLDYVADVDPVNGDTGRISGVAYGIGMRFYLGLRVADLEIDWWRRQKKLSLGQIFTRFTEAYRSYATYAAAD